MARQLLLLTCYRRRKTDVRRHEMTYSRTHDRPKADPQGTGPLHIFWFSSSVPSPVRTIYVELTHGGCVLGGWAAENEPQSGSVTFPTTYFMSFDMYIFVSWYFPISQWRYSDSDMLAQPFVQGRSDAAYWTSRILIGRYCAQQICPHLLPRLPALTLTPAPGAQVRERLGLMDRWGWWMEWGSGISWIPGMG